MHILLFNEYYPPDTSATAKMAVQVAETLARRHQVTVVAGRPSYDPDEFYPFAFLRRDTRNDVTVERVGSTAYPRHRMRRRVSNYLSYLALAVPRALAIRPDVVLAMTDPPVAGIAGAFVARMAGRPFVYNIRDLYPDMAIGGDIVRPGGWVERWEKMHRRALRRAARVIVLGDDMRERILSKGVEPERVVVVRDGTSFPASMPCQSDPIVQEIRCGFPFVVVHAGNLGFYGAWDTLLKAAEILRNEDTGFVFIGDGANRAALEAAAANSAERSLLAFPPGRAGAARDDGGRCARRDGAARTRRRRRPEQALFDSRGRAPRAGGRGRIEATPRASYANPAAGLRPIPDDPSRRGRGDSRASRRSRAACARWAAARVRPRRNMLE